KWIRKDESISVAADIWRLCLSKQIENERIAKRVYLLLGGAGDSFGSTISILRNQGLNLKWSPAGRPRLSASSGIETTLNFSRAIRIAETKDNLINVLKWGKGANLSPHVRSSGIVYSSLNAHLVASWYSSQLDNSWKLALWEFKKVPHSRSTLDIDAVISNYSTHC